MIADRIAVLYLGKVLEIGPADRVIHHPRHPYTKSLVSVIPTPEPERRAERIILAGETPSPVDIPPGCRFAARCWLRYQRGDPPECRSLEPSLEGQSQDHLAACHFASAGDNDGDFSPS